MCIICLEFNKRKDFVDAERMIEAARREANVISDEHLEEVEETLAEIKQRGTSEDIPKAIEKKG